RGARRKPRPLRRWPLRPGRGSPPRTTGRWAVLQPGPGKVLAGLWGQTEFGATLAALPVNTAEGINAL
ncbi:MAG: hypothetical protein ILP07_13110, partial [Treponema sp.]|nr:hypothetical protein [Treponema sp.]